MLLNPQQSTEPSLLFVVSFEQVSNPTAASESALAQLADGTLTAIMRMDGDCGCSMTESRGECGVYRWYHQSFSSE